MTIEEPSFFLFFVHWLHFPFPLSLSLTYWAEKRDGLRLQLLRDRSGVQGKNDNEGAKRRGREKEKKQTPFFSHIRFSPIDISTFLSLSSTLFLFLSLALSLIRSPSSDTTPSCRTSSPSPRLQRGDPRTQQLDARSPSSPSTSRATPTASRRPLGGSPARPSPRPSAEGSAACRPLG